MARNTNGDNSSVNILGPGTEVKGDIISNGDIRIDGKLVGSIKTDGKLVVGQTGVIEGEVECKNSDLAGSFQGKITVSELLVLKATVKVKGDIYTSKLSIEPGALFTGTCNMDGSERAVNAGRKQK